MVKPTNQNVKAYMQYKQQANAIWNASQNTGLANQYDENSQLSLMGGNMRHKYNSFSIMPTLANKRYWWRVIGAKNRELSLGHKNNPSILFWAQILAQWQTLNSSYKN